MPTVAVKGKLVGEVDATRISGGGLTDFAPTANTRILDREQAQQVYTLLRKYDIEFISTDRIQPWSFNWSVGQGQKITPCYLHLTLRENWDGEELINGQYQNRGYQRINGIAIYDVGIDGIRQGRQWQGHPDETQGYHSNSFEISSADFRDLKINLWKII